MKEQRRYARFIEENRIVIEISGEENWEGRDTVIAFTKDLSLRGAMLETDRSFLPGTELKMTMYLSRSSQVAKVSGRIKWVKEIDQGLYRFGIEFIHDSPVGFMSLISHLFGKQTKIPTTIHI